MERVTGSGYGYGYGDCFGSGYGSGSGYGYGDGSGYGSGSGYGYGYGDCFGYWRSIAEEAPGARAAVSNGAVIAFWRSDGQGRPANGGSGEPVKVGDVQETPGPLELCRRGTLHATRLPTQWGGERVWVVALYGQVAGDDEKMGALKREILAEVCDNGFRT